VISVASFFSRKKGSRSDDSKPFILLDDFVIISAQFNGCHVQKSVMDKVTAAKLLGHYVVDDLYKMLYNIRATELYIIM
jgi:hypothetical protein